MATKAKENPFTWTTGRRKSAIARVRMKPGAGKFIVNDREFEEYFTTTNERKRVLAPLAAVGAEKTFDIFVTAHGGGYDGQSGAISMGIARALLKVNPDHEKILREGKFLTRDSREKERKKYGRRGARRGFQFSKR